MRAPLIRATDVRGARVAVPLEPGDTVDAARARLAAAYGHDDARAVIGSIKTHPNVSSVDIKGVHAWVERFGSDDAEVVVVGFVKVKAKPRRLQPRPSAATAVDARAATTEGPCTSLASIERASTGANASTARETTDDACAELALAAAADATARAQFPLPASLETLHVAYVALCKACLFLSRQGQQPSWRVASQAVHASLRLTLEDARAMETLCPSSIRLINRRRRRLSMDDAVDATANANDDDETIVDVTAPEDADGSGYSNCAGVDAVATSNCFNSSHTSHTSHAANCSISSAVACCSNASRRVSNDNALSCVSSSSRSAATTSRMRSAASADSATSAGIASHNGVACAETTRRQRRIRRRQRRRAGENCIFHRNPPAMVPCSCTKSRALSRFASFAPATRHRPRGDFASQRRRTLAYARARRRTRPGEIVCVHPRAA